MHIKKGVSLYQPPASSLLPPASCLLPPASCLLPPAPILLLLTPEPLAKCPIPKSSIEIHQSRFQPRDRPSSAAGWDRASFQRCTTALLILVPDLTIISGRIICRCHLVPLPLPLPLPRHTERHTCGDLFSLVSCLALPRPTAKGCGAQT
jgi:hypothetical protein